jgi:hypothetical protein
VGIEEFRFRTYWACKGENGCNSNYSPVNDHVKSFENPIRKKTRNIHDEYSDP